GKALGMLAITEAQGPDELPGACQERQRQEGLHREGLVERLGGEAALRDRIAEGGLPAAERLCREGICVVQVDAEALEGCGPRAVGSYDSRPLFPLQYLPEEPCGIALRLGDRLEQALPQEVRIETGHGDAGDLGLGAQEAGLGEEGVCRFSQSPPYGVHRSAFGIVVRCPPPPAEDPV